MASEMLEKVLAAEKATQAAENTAKEQAETIIAESKRRAQTILAQAEIRIKAGAEAADAAAKKQADEIIREAAGRAEEEAEQIKNNAALKRGAAVQAVIDRLLPSV